MEKESHLKCRTEPILISTIKRVALSILYFNDFLPKYKIIAAKTTGSKLTINGFLDEKIKNESHIFDQVLEKSELILIGIS